MDVSKCFQTHRLLSIYLALFCIISLTVKFKFAVNMDYLQCFDAVGWASVPVKTE